VYCDAHPALATQDSPVPGGVNPVNGWADNVMCLLPQFSLNVASKSLSQFMLLKTENVGQPVHIFMKK
jgi:hypothetical protein